MPAEGAAGAVDVLAQVDGTSPGGTPVTGAYPTPPPLAELMADPLSGPDGGYPPACSTPHVVAAGCWSQRPGAWDLAQEAFALSEAGDEEDLS